MTTKCVLSKLFPSYAHIYIAPFHEMSFIARKTCLCNIFNMNDCFRRRQISGNRVLVAKPIKNVVNFYALKKEDLLEMEFPFEYKIVSTGLIHGFTLRPNLIYCGSEISLKMPFHWNYATLAQPILAHRGSIITGR